MKKALKREQTIHRQTKETDIRITFCLDGQGRTSIKTGVPFMDHMLTLFAVHGFFDLVISATGDTDVDYHHTVEDLGISMGQALRQALGDYGAINRYGSSLVPMDEALVQTALDCSNRPHLHYGVSLKDQKVGDFDTALAKEFLRAFCLHSGITLHVHMFHGENAHHILEAVFKSLGRALDQAASLNDRTKGPLSSKGVIV
jgi:imidazoleglycerol-phosphate dehydratase